MQILGKRSKILLSVVAIAMLVAVGVSFATWDITAVKASNGDLSLYANAKVGDIIEFGNYYQSAVDLTKKDIITWIVVDKDERTGQLTLLSEKILACGSYFGNYYDDGTGYNWNYNKTTNDDGTTTYSAAEVGGIPYNQAYVDSTVRAYLNNLERLDLGGDGFTSGTGFVPSKFNSTTEKGLLSSVGFSNQRYWTKLSYETPEDRALIDNKTPGLFKRIDNNEIYYQRPIEQSAYQNRPASKGFYDEAFTNEEKSMIVPKVIAGYTGHRWPDGDYGVSTKSYVEGTCDKIWLPSVTELNVMEGEDWTNLEDHWTNPSDDAGSTVFEYFKNYKDYGFSSVADALKTTKTNLATDGMAGNYSIPVYDKGTTTAKDDTKISRSANTSEYYWTRSTSSSWVDHARVVNDSGLFFVWPTHYSYGGVRPCVILKY